ncbi:S1 RNA-binding domain-containing protein [Helicobacter sp. MIT 14-3879]|uniref:S1 RNA-binding domain-containing protein n=1 Tax=Helicobacter sp. MIT 14-3879 TaxID=2040649 RepID=UPI000E1EBA70|nr:S1 RNA-binding domain-containing protein [Helicobacter sp. MIT 14-3879]RDU64160.1 30S ribosomal protein S1 [Helicobacter sp. MIT 14-3879]
MAIAIDDIELSNQDKEDFKEFETLFMQSDNSISKDIDSGNISGIQKGKIIKIDDNVVMVDIGRKAESRMHIDEIKDNNGELLFNVGSEIDIFINNKGRISYKQAQRQIKIKNDIKKIQEKYNNAINMIIDVEILSRNKNGFVVRWIDEDVECFLPIRDSAIKLDSKIPDKPIRVCITKINDNGIFTSRKKYFDISNKNKKEKIKEILDITTPLKGEVVSITQFGIFVNIDGVEGMVHSSEINHKNFANPASLYKTGDIVEVKVLKYDEEKSKLSLSIKALIKDPWEDITEHLQVGYTIKVVVSSIQPYGVFVDAGNDIEGFLHVTEISWEKNIRRPNDYLQVGQEIDVEIIELDPAKKRLRVSLKRLVDKPFIQFTKKYKEGDILTGNIATITDFGAFVRFGNIDGLLHNEDLSWDKQDKCKNVLKLGDNIEVKVLKIDKENEKISLSRKAMIESPVYTFSNKNKVGDIVSGEIVEIKNFGIFVKISDNIDALIKNEDLPPLKKDDLKIGDSIEASIVYIDTQNNKIRLSVKKLARKKEQDEIKNYNSNEKMTLGDILKDRLK